MKRIIEREVVVTEKVVYECDFCGAEIQEISPYEGNWYQHRAASLVRKELQHADAVKMAAKQDNGYRIYEIQAKGTYVNEEMAMLCPECAREMNEFIMSKKKSNAAPLSERACER
jgi:uncharacterized Zn ribbon protein